jgi:hypothetical protein
MGDWEEIERITGMKPQEFEEACEAWLETIIEFLVGLSEEDWKTLQNAAKNWTLRPHRNEKMN